MDTNPDNSRAESLRRFDRLQELPTVHLKEICDKAEWLQVKRKALLIDLGSDEKTTIFLLKGNVLLEAADGRTKIIKHTEKSATLPISRLRPSTYKVTALTRVSYLRIDNNLLDGIYHLDEPSTLMPSHYEVSESSEEESDSHAQLLMHIYEDLNHDRLKMLSWYPVSRAISGQVLAENKDIERLAQYVMLDPILLLKVIKKSNATSEQIASQTCKGAITMMGVRALHKLVFLNLFSESAHTENELFKGAYLAAWERSIAVAHVARLLARSKQHLNPDYIALAGLLHNVGELVLIIYAFRFPAPLTQEDLDEVIRLYAVEVGKVILSHLHLPRKLIEAVTESSNWMRDSFTQSDDADFILLARVYTALARKEHKNAPKMEEMPACQKMKLDLPNGELHWKLKTAASVSVDETFSFLNATKI
ncbi:MAG: HDOD domain-containing protein [Bacteroidetes bacterium]|nr:HDOD domain-containing protein [Bacteroidota bacterium]